MEVMFKAVGMSFVDGYPDNLHELRDAWGSVEGEGSLIREPDNAYDPNAVAILCAGRVIAHAPRAIASRLAPLIDNGRQFAADLSVLVDPDHEDKPGLLVVATEVVQ